MTIKRDFTEFYKVQVNTHNIYNKNLLNILYKSGSPFPYIKQNQKISDELVSVLIDLFDTNKINYNILKKCSESELHLFDVFMIRSGSSVDLRYKRLNITEENIVDRLTLLHAAIIAGNDSPIILEELIILIQKLVKLDRISKVDGSQLFIDLL
jgi:hypothetical protein